MAAFFANTREAIMKRLKPLDMLDQALKATICLSLASMVVFVFLNVVLRYVFNSGLAWSGEVARYLFVWVIFLGSVVAVKEQSHLGVDLLVSKLNLSVQKILYSASAILIVGVLGFAAHGLLGLIELNAGMGGPASGVPINTYYYAGLISSVLMSVIVVIHAIRFALFNKSAPPWAKLPKSESEGDGS
jgi:TRAP-type C4-dicarboxylate transport system permease small subunit